MTIFPAVNIRSRRDKQQHGPDRSYGFNVIELMIVVAVSSILTTLAFPTYKSLVQKRELTAAAEGIRSMVVFARQEAIKRNEEVTVAWYSPGGHDAGWCIGLSAGEVPCDCTESVVSECVIDDVPYRLNQSDFPRAGDQFFHAVPSEAANGYFTFDPIRGILDPDTLPAEVETRIINDEHIFQVHSDTRGEDDSGSSRWFALQMKVNHTGSFSICADTSRKSVIGGYPQC